MIDHSIFIEFLPISSVDWELNPVAAYTNSYILNGKIFVPQYGIDDENALSVYQEAMPGYMLLVFLARKKILGMLKMLSIVELLVFLILK